MRIQNDLNIINDVEDSIARKLDKNEIEFFKKAVAKFHKNGNCIHSTLLNDSKYIHIILNPYTKCTKMIHFNINKVFCILSDNQISNLKSQIIQFYIDNCFPHVLNTNEVMNIQNKIDLDFQLFQIQYFKSINHEKKHF